jgi:hypothetical protein
LFFLFSYWVSGVGGGCGSGGLFFSPPSGRTARRRTTASTATSFGGTNRRTIMRNKPLLLGGDQRTRATPRCHLTTSPLCRRPRCWRRLLRAASPQCNRRTQSPVNGGRSWATYQPALLNMPAVKILEFRLHSSVDRCLRFEISTRCRSMTTRTVLGKPTIR